MKKLIIASAALSTLLLSGTASAFEGYQTTFVNPALGTSFGAGAGCISCHASGITSKATLTTPFYNSYRSGLSSLALGNADSDGDGFTNKQEAIGNVNDFNMPTITPFTKAMGGVPLTNVHVTGDMQATEKVITSTGAGITVPAGSAILGGVAIDVYASPTSTAPVTLLYKAGAAALTSTVYAVDTYAIAIADPYATNTTLRLAATDWTLTAQGGVKISQLPAGADATYDIVVVRVTPTSLPIANPVNTGVDSDGEGDDNDNDGESDSNGSTNPTLPACVGGISTVPLLMFLVLLLPIFMTRRKKTSSFQSK